MALPIRPTPVLTGEDAERLDAYMAESEHKKEPLRNIQIGKDAIHSIINAIKMRQASNVSICSLI